MKRLDDHGGGVLLGMLSATTTRRAERQAAVTLAVAQDATGSAHATTERDRESAKLLTRAKGGDDRAFADYVTATRALVLSCARTVLRNEPDAEEAAQDTYVALWRLLPKLDIRESGATGLLVTMARQCAIAMIRHRCAKRRGGESRAMLDDELAMHYHDLHARRRNRNVTQATPREPEFDPLRRMGLIHQLIGQIPPEFLSVLDGHFFQGHSVEALAKMHGVKSPEMANRVSCGLQVARHLAAKASSDAEEEQFAA